MCSQYQAPSVTISNTVLYGSRLLGYTTPSEHAFSGGGLTGMKHRNGLNATVFESLQLLKSAYWNGHTLTADDATQHLDALITALEDEVDDDMPSLASLNS